MKVAKSQQNLMCHIENTFLVVCVVFACHMTIKETLRFLKNDDLSYISYKNFGSTSKDTYPTLSLCLVDEKYDDGLDGLIYSYFKDDIRLTLPIENPWYPAYWYFYRIMTGKDFDRTLTHKDELDIFNVSEAYANTFEIELERLYYEIEFQAENINDSLKLSIVDDFRKNLPFYVSYQDPNTVCFTRNKDEREGIIRVKDTLMLFKDKLKRFDGQIEIKLFIHHPGQLLRGLQSPRAHAELKDIISTDTESLNTDLKKSKWDFKVSQVSILRKRANANAPAILTSKMMTRSLGNKFHKKLDAFLITGNALSLFHSIMEAAKPQIR